MSPLLINHHAYCSKQRIRLASCGWDGKALSRRRASIDPSPEMLLTRLQELINQMPRGKLGQDRINLVLGSPWVRYASLPWQDGLHKDSDWENYARLMLSQQYGVNADGWRVRVSDCGFGQPRIAAAVDEGVYQTLAELCRSSQLKLGQVEPLFISVVNHHRRHLSAPEHALVVLESTHSIVGFYREHAWHGIVTLPAQIENNAKALAAMVREAAVLSGQFLPEQIYLSSSDSSWASSKSADFDFEWLGAAHPQFIANEASE